MFNRQIASGTPNLSGVIFGLMGSRTLSLIIRTAASLVVARVAGPYAVGLIGWLGIFPLYAGWLTLGAVNGAERQVPVLRGKGEPSRIDGVWSAAWNMVYLAAFLCVITGMAISLACLVTGHPIAAWKACFSGILCAITLFSSSVMANLAAEKRFADLNRLFIMEGICWLILVPCAWGGKWGLVVRLLLATFVPALLTAIHTRILRPPRRFTRGTLRPLLKDGLPILTATFFQIQGFGLCRTLVGAFLGDVEMGYFVLAMNVLAMIRLMNYSVTKVLLPNIGELFGHSGDTRHIAVSTCKPLLQMLPVTAVLTVAGWFLAEPVTRLILPQFLPGVPAARIALLGMIPTVMTSTHVFFIATGKQKRMILVFCIGLISQFLIAIPLYHQGYGLSAFAWGFTGGMAVTAVIVNAALFYYLLGRNTQTGATGRETT